MITDIVFGYWEGDATILVYHSDGHLDGFVHLNDQWKAVHPADVATKASVMTIEQFHVFWPDLELPAALLTEQSRRKITA